MVSSYRISRENLLLFLLTFFLVPGNLYSWGFFAHRLINRGAVLCIPYPLTGFYKKHIHLLEEHATDPDNRRYLDPEEAPRHYIDFDRYESDTVPLTWTKAVEKFTADTLHAHGIVPWHIQRMYYRLVKAFSEKNEAFILRTSADIGHYVADAHVPLHTTSNYNGQKTGQKGIHGFWESRLPELFSTEYDLLTGRAYYIEDIVSFSWQIVHESYSMKDSVLELEAKLNESFPSALKFTYEQRGRQEVKVQSREYAREYDNLLNRMVKRRMRSAILSVASIWYSAWVDAGQPDLNNEDEIKLSADSVRSGQAVLKLAGHED